jgi:hypothetical protein
VGFELRLRVRWCGRARWDESTIVLSRMVRMRDCAVAVLCTKLAFSIKRMGIIAQAIDAVNLGIVSFNSISMSRSPLISPCKIVAMRMEYLCTSWLCSIEIQGAAKTSA